MVDIVDIKKILADIIGVDVKEIKDDSHIDNTPLWDSLAHLHLVIEIERKFDILLTSYEIETMIDISTIEKVLKKKEEK